MANEREPSARAAGPPPPQCVPPSRPTTRFAPSVTGRLHLGHVAHAIYVWGLARALNGRVLLRLEDHDRGRCRPDYEAAILDDLEWLGFRPDAPPYEEFRSGASAFRQSDVPDEYAECLTRLRDHHRVYPCDCSRRRRAKAPGGTERYSGRCRTREVPEGEESSLRIVMAPGPETFDDCIRGAGRDDPATRFGDPVLRDRTGNWTYLFCVVVDDLRHGVDFIVRGVDLYDTTAQQVRLGRMLGRARPALFAHHPLIRGPDGRKLSKRDGADGVDRLRRAGVPATGVLGRAAHRVGLIDRPRDLAADAVVTLFDTWRRANVSTTAQG